MKILIFSWRGPGHPHAGGAEIVTHVHAKAWVKAGHEVTLFTSFFTGGKRIEIVDGVKIIRQGGEILGVQIKAFIWYLFCKNQKFDLVIDQFHGLPFFTPLYVRVKKLAFIHEVAKEVWKLNPWPKPFNILPAWLGVWGEPWIFRLLYRKVPFMTVSESTKSDLINWGIPATNITIVHNGVEVIKLRPLPKKEERKTAIFLGALSQDKGIFDAVQIFGQINKTDKNWQFWIVGKGDSRLVELLKKMCGDLRIKNKVKFWGYVNQNEKFKLLAKAHILVNPSVREGWGLVNIEADACGTPVVAYEVPGIKDSVINKKTGLLVKPHDIEGLAETALFLLSNQKLYQRLQKQALVWSRNFTEEKCGKESLQLLESL